jgi:bifunctional DNase/RNase
MVEVTVHEVYQQKKESSISTVVVLKARDRERYLPIWISFPQATDIAMNLQGQTTDRPNTYNLMAQLVERLNGRLELVHIASLEGTTYHASLRLVQATPLRKSTAGPAMPWLWQ